MRGSEHAGGDGSRAAVDDERNDATTEMTIIRADKIAFDERQPAALHPLKPARRHHPPSLPHTPPLTSPRKSIGPETQQDRKLDSGDQRREEGRGRRPSARPDDRSGRAGRRFAPSWP